MTHPRAKHAEIEREERRRKVAGILLSGVTDQSAIAKQFNVDRSTISRDIKIIEERWRADAAADIATAKGQDLQRIERLIAALWPAATKGQWLAVDRITALLSRKAAMLGYDAPKRVEGKFDIETRRAAERVAAELGLSVDEVLDEAERILKVVTA
jgi:hypothetical protein